MNGQKGDETIGGLRKAFRVLLIILGLGVLAVPPVVLITSGTAALDATWTSVRLSALLALSLIFLDITTGAFRPLFNRLYRARTVQRFHTAFALTGFALALAHGILTAVLGLAGFDTVAVAVGPVALLVLTVVILTALMRQRLRHIWRWIHRLNYLVFTAIIVHAFILGYDVKKASFLKIVMIVYAVAALLGLAYRVSIYLRSRRRKKAS
ncbi:MAG: hypothetical protein ACOC78_03825 [Actinomycetota bacterium]